ncbi:MAG: type II toxin-antitoxin system HicA family toxin [Phycisphaerales bacterium]|nr:type II toxin-antitoxin system HicA family toxin [Phycisphaerales bacterium]
MDPRKLLQRISTNPVNVKFSDFTRLVQAFGFELDRHSGTSHRIYKHSGLPEARLNLQPVSGEAKPYQVRQFLKIVEEYDLRLSEER